MYRFHTGAFQMGGATARREVCKCCSQASRTRSNAYADLGVEGT